MEMISGGNPRELLERIAKTYQELADAIEGMLKYWGAHAV
jgi:hypothetical protein